MYESAALCQGLRCFFLLISRAGLRPSDTRSRGHAAAMMPGQAEARSRKFNFFTYQKFFVGCKLPLCA